MYAHDNASGNCMPYMEKNIFVKKECPDKSGHFL